MNIESIVTEANLAPSVHNTQPTRWAYDGNALLLSLDETRLLSIADPSGRDARLSMGTALMGTRIAANREGLGVRGIELDEQQVRVEFGAKVESGWDADLVKRRLTWRSGFKAGPKADLSAIASRDDAQLTGDSNLIDAIAVLNDETSLTIMRDHAFRDELLDWMRLSKRDARWASDGLNAESLGLSGFEALAAGVVLRRPVFGVLDALGLGISLTGEAAKTRSSHWIVAFHRPHDEDPLISGEAFYELWLMLTALGQAAWPMAALADEPDASREVSRLMGVPEAHKLINVLRVGPLPDAIQPKARLSLSELIVNYEPVHGGTQK